MCIYVRLCIYILIYVHVLIYVCVRACGCVYLCTHTTALIGVPDCANFPCIYVPVVCSLLEWENSLEFTRRKYMIVLPAISEWLLLSLAIMTNNDAWTMLIAITLIFYGRSYFWILFLGVNYNKRGEFVFYNCLCSFSIKAFCILFCA